MNIAIIPARSGSKRIKNKNVRAFFGKPIIAYSIENALACGIFQEVVVSTDSQDYAAVAKAYGAKVHMRARELATDQVGTQEVAKAALEWWAVTHPDKPVDIACCLYATAPNLQPEDLLRAYTALLRDRLDYVYLDGWFYLGQAQAFVNDIGLEMAQSRRLPHPEERWIDINTEEDWMRAEAMYAGLQQREAAQ